jgi:hypothetical protein
VLRHGIADNALVLLLMHDEQDRLQALLVGQAANRGRRPVMDPAGLKV